MKSTYGTPQLARECSRTLRLAGGVKGHTIMKQFLTGKPRPVGGELHFLRSRHSLQYGNDEHYLRKVDFDIAVSRDCLSGPDCTIAVCCVVR